MPLTAGAQSGPSSPFRYQPGVNGLDPVVAQPPPLGGGALFYPADTHAFPDATRSVIVVDPSGNAGLRFGANAPLVTGWSLRDDLDPPRELVPVEARPIGPVASLMLEHNAARRPAFVQEMPGGPQLFLLHHDGTSNVLLPGIPLSLTGALAIGAVDNSNMPSPSPRDLFLCRSPLAPECDGPFPSFLCQCHDDIWAQLYVDRFGCEPPAPQFLPGKDVVAVGSSGLERVVDNPCTLDPDYQSTGEAPWSSFAATAVALSGPPVLARTVSLTLQLFPGVPSRTSEHLVVMGDGALFTVTFGATSPTASTALPYLNLAKVTDAAVGNVVQAGESELVISGISAVPGVTTGLEVVGFDGTTGAPVNRAVFLEPPTPEFEGCSRTPAERVAVADYDSGVPAIWYAGIEQVTGTPHVCVLKQVGPAFGVNLSLADQLAINSRGAGQEVVSFFADHLDTDGLTDALVAFRAATGPTQVVAIRRRPRPGATYVAVYSHGQVPKYAEAVVPFLPLNPAPVDELDITIRGLGSAFPTINEGRRPANNPSSGAPGFEDMPPIDFVGIPGHWEQATMEGIRLIAYGRGAAYASMAAVVPTAVPPRSCQPLPVPALPGFPLVSRTGDSWPFPLDGFGNEPHQWWLQMASLIAIPRLCQPGPLPSLDYSSVEVRSGLAGFGYASLQLGSQRSGQASRRVASEFAETVRREVRIARDRMGGPCQGQVFLDVAGHSRGGALTAEVLRALARSARGSEDPLREDRDLLSNAAVRGLLVDAIDPSVENPWFPWVHSGYAVDDAVVGPTRDESWVSVSAGSSSISDSVDGITPQPAALLAWLPGTYGSPSNRCDDDALACVGPSPVGYVRDNLRGQSSNVETLEEIPATNHSTIFGRYNLPEDIAGRVGAPNSAPGLIRDTLVGQLIGFPASGGLAGRMPLPDGTGWHGAPTSGGQNDVAFAGCSVDGTPDLPPPLLPPVNAYAPTGNRVRQFANDGCFRVGRAIVRGAQVIKDSPRAKAAVTGAFDGWADWLAGIDVMAQQQWPLESAWESDGPPPLLLGVDEMSPPVAASDLANLMRQQWQLPPAGTTQMTPEFLGGQLMRAALDREHGGEVVDHLASVAAGIQSAAYAIAQFPPGPERIIHQNLHPASRGAAQLVLEAEFFVGPSGCVTVEVRGPGLEVQRQACAATQGARHRVQFVAQRDLEVAHAASPAAADVLTVRAQGANLYCVSVRTEPARLLTSNGHLYELVVEPHGADWRTAQATASRMVRAGAQGQLAVFESREEMDAVAVLLQVDVDAWVGANVIPASGQFRWSNGERLDGALLASVPDASRTDVHAVMMVRAPDGVGLLASPPRTMSQGRPVGFLVEYGTDFNTAPGNGVTVNLAQGVTVTFTEVSQGQTSATTSQTPNVPIPAGLDAVGDYWEIATSADTSGPVRVCLPIPDGVTPATVQVAHQTAGDWTLLDTTVTDNGAQACAFAESLSQFVLVVLRSPTGPAFAGVVPSMTVEQQDSVGAQVALPLPTATQADGSLLSVYSNAPNVFPPGATVVTFSAVTSQNVPGTAQTLVTVVDTTPPAFVVVPQDVVVEAVAAQGTPVALAPPVLWDAVDASPRVLSNAPPLFPLGETVVSWTATDAAGNRSVATNRVLVVDTTPPVIAGLTANPGTLWPPNHRLVAVSVFPTANDAADANVTCWISSVTSNEPSQGPGNQNDVDWILTGPRSVLLRAERLGAHPGRVYSLDVMCMDGSGNQSATMLAVPVTR